MLLCAQAYVHAQRTPLFWMVHSKQVADFTWTFKCGKWQYKWWFFVYFWKIKGMNLQNNDVWRMIHHKLMYERDSWMGLSACTFFMPSGCALGHKQSLILPISISIVCLTHFCQKVDWVCFRKSLQLFMISNILHVKKCTECNYIASREGGNERAKLETNNEHVHHSFTSEILLRNNCEIFFYPSFFQTIV